MITNLSDFLVSFFYVFGCVNDRTRNFINFLLLKQNGVIQW